MPKLREKGFHAAAHDGAQECWRSKTGGMEAIA